MRQQCPTFGKPGAAISQPLDNKIPQTPKKNQALETLS